MGPQWSPASINVSRCRQGLRFTPWGPTGPRFGWLACHLGWTLRFKWLPGFYSAPFAPTVWGNGTTRGRSPAIFQWRADMGSVERKAFAKNCLNGQARSRRPRRSKLRARAFSECPPCGIRSSRTGTGLCSPETADFPKTPCSAGGRFPALRKSGTWIGTAQSKTCEE